MSQLQRQSTKIASVKKTGSKLNVFEPQRSKSKLNMSAILKGKSGLALDDKTKNMIKRGSLLLIRRLSGIAGGLEEGNEEEEDDRPPKIELTLAQLEEDMPAKILEPKNPCAPKVSISYNHIDRKYERNEIVDQLVMHFEYDGETIIKDSEEHKIQEELIEMRDHLIKETVRQHELMDSQQNFDMKEAKKILRNKFNYSERQAQTGVRWIKERGVSTAKPK